MVHPVPMSQFNGRRRVPLSVVNTALLFLLCSQGRPEFSEVVTKLEECLCNIEVRALFPLRSVCGCAAGREHEWGEQRLREAVALEPASCRGCPVPWAADTLWS